MMSSYIGTYKYMSPEIRLDFSRYSFKTDVWSAGCILFELITLNVFVDYIESNRFILQTYEIPDHLTDSNILASLLKMMLKYDQNERANSSELANKIKQLNQIQTETPTDEAHKEEKDLIIYNSKYKCVERLMLNQFENLFKIINLNDKIER